jgi:hypothetical protein
LPEREKWTFSAAKAGKARSRLPRRQKFGGMEALDQPYMQIGFGAIINKRADGYAHCF